MKKITNLKIKKFKKHLENQNKAKSTIDCYVRYVSDFRDWLDEYIANFENEVIDL